MANVGVPSQNRPNYGLSANHAVYLAATLLSSGLSKTKPETPEFSAVDEKKASVVKDMSSGTVFSRMASNMMSLFDFQRFWTAGQRRDPLAWEKVGS